MIDTPTEFSKNEPCTVQKTRSPTPGYFELSQRPLYVLLFLLPFLAAYELGATVFLSGHDGTNAQTIAAWGMLAKVFANFGVMGYHLPAILLITVLLIWHLLERDPWTLRLPVLVGMAMEACVLTVPLTIIAMLLAGGPGAVVLGQAGTAPDAVTHNLQNLSEGARLTISVGAGLYEELLFRMILIAAIHALLVDLMRLPNWIGGILAVVTAAAAFALYHRVPAGDPQTTQNLIFFFVAGLYFGSIYLVRGFGLVVAIHALYDILALVVIGSGAGS